MVEPRHEPLHSEKEKTEGNDRKAGNQRAQAEHHYETENCCCDGAREMERHHAHHHPDVVYVRHHAGNEITPVMGSEEVVGKRGEVGEEIPADFEFDLSGAIQDSGSSEIFKRSLEESENRGECNNPYHLDTETACQPIYREFYQVGDCCRKGGAKDEGCNPLKKNSPISLDIGDDELNLLEHVVLGPRGRSLPAEAGFYCAKTGPFLSKARHLRYYLDFFTAFFRRT
jgi:hypothetical protein